MNTLLSVSIALLAGLIMTRIFKPLKLPAVTAYLIAGVLVGPYFAFFVGIIGDLLGTLIGGRDINVLITLSSGLMGLIFGLIYHYFPIKNKWIKIIIAMILVCLIVTLGTNTLAQIWPVKKYANFWIALATRTFQPVILLVNTIIVAGLIPIVEKFTKYKWTK